MLTQTESPGDDETSPTLGVAAMFGAAVRLRRTELELRQQDIADRCVELGLPPMSRLVVAAVENGTRRVTIDDMVVLCVVLDMELGAALAHQPGWVLDALGLAPVVVADPPITEARVREIVGEELVQRLLGGQ